MYILVDFFLTFCRGKRSSCSFACDAPDQLVAAKHLQKGRIRINDVTAGAAKLQRAESEQTSLSLVRICKNKLIPIYLNMCC